VRIQRGSQRVYLRWQWIAEILVLSPAESVTGHIHGLPESVLLRVPANRVVAIIGRQQPRKNCVACIMKHTHFFIPIDSLDALRKGTLLWNENWLKIHNTWIYLKAAKKFSAPSVRFAKVSIRGSCGNPNLAVHDSLQQCDSSCAFAARLILPVVLVS